MVKKNTRNARKLTRKQTDFLKILKKNMGLITISCEKAAMARRTYYLWLENPTFAEEVENIEQYTKDFGEGALYKLIDAGNPQTIRFYNKTKNRDRGYVERQEIEHTGDMNQNIQIKEEIKKDLRKALKFMSKEQKKAYLEEIKEEE